MKKLILINALFAGWLTAYAQQNETIRPQNVNIASPNAAALGKVADIPVSYQAGIPNVSIPIYTVTDGSLQVPISLSYHASGLKVMEQASWVGAGWSLSAGGMITRSVRGLADEVIVLNGPGGNSPISYLSSRGYYKYLFLNEGNAYDPPILPNNNGLDWNRFATGMKDGEADLFTFNFNGYSGKFYFRPDNSVVIVPQQDIQITPLFCADSNPNCNSTIEKLYGWVVTTPDGVKYYFGKTLIPSTDTDPIEQTQSFSVTAGASFIKTISSWFLFKIVSSDQESVITFSYDKENYSYYSLSLFPSYQSGPGYDLVKNYTYGVRLKAISFANGSVTLNPSTSPRQDLSAATPVDMADVDQTTPGDPLLDFNAKALDNIQISGTNFCQKFSFAYDYFYDQTSGLTGNLQSYGSYNIHCDRKRLKLKSITESTCDGSVSKPPHVFTYFEESSVPRTLSFAQDHWGFFNGVTSNAQLIPPLSKDGGITNIPEYNANRESAWPAMRAGSLQLIQYPTGGYTRFVFNSHKVYVPVTSMDSIYIGYQNATYTNVSPGIPFTIAQTTTFKSRVTIPYYPNGSGSVSVGPAGLGLHIFTLPAGSYTFQVTSTSGTWHPYECKLWKFVGPYTQYQEKVVGGLRIDSIIYNNGLDNKQVVQAFSYVDGSGVSQGVLYSRPSYISMIQNTMLVNSGGHPTSPMHVNFECTDGCVHYSGSTMAYYVSPSSIHPMRTLQGNHFGYNQVRVTQSDGGYTIYKFPLHGNDPGDVCNRVIDYTTCDLFAPNYPPAPPQFDFGRDELVNKSVYSASGTLLHETRYSSTYVLEQIGVRGLITKQLPTGLTIATEYEQKNAKKTQVTEEEFTYNSSGQSPVYIKTDTYFESVHHTQPTKIVISDSNNGKVFKELRKNYLPDIVNPIAYVADTYTNTYLNALASRVSNQNTTLSGCPQTSNPADCKFKAWLTYQYYINLDRIAYVNAKRAYDSTFNKTITSSTAWTNASTDLKPLLKLRNRNQINQSVELSMWRDNKFLESSYLKYKDFGNDSIRIYPTKYEVIKPLTPQLASYFTTAYYASNGITKDAKYGQEDSYIYSDGNLVEVAPKNGVTTSYIWDYNNSEPIASVTNSPVSKCAYTGFEADGSGGWTIGSSTRQTSSPVFGGKYYNVNLGAISKTVPTGTSYTVSFWSPGAIIKVNGATPTAGLSRNGWTNYYITVSGVTNISVTATATAYIDELRLYPSNAQMTTYTYDPLIGIKQQIDPGNQSTLYEYDGLGRLLRIRDDKNYILKTYKYNYDAGTSQAQ